MIQVNNPIATPIQHEFERRALKLCEHPEIQRTKTEARQFWLDEIKPKGAMRESFEWAFEEVMFGAVIWSLNQDPLYPEVITISRIAHKLGDLDIPGSRWGIDNPDSVYRVIPISGDERYVIRGRVAEPRLSENYFTLWDEHMGTVDVLDGKALVLDADGGFAISVDSDEAGERANHIRSSPAARQFYIRDVLLDWAAERPNELTIERLGPPPSRPPFSEAQQIELTCQYMWDWVKNTIRWNGQAIGKPPNAFDFKIDRDQDGALRNQIYILSKFELRSPDQALLFTVDLGGAGYFLAPITNFWGTTNDIVHRNGSLNLSQAVTNPDGSVTMVLSLTDPGVHNWLDPCGMSEGILTLRWAEFAGGVAGDSLRVDSRLLPLSELQQHLPAGTPMVTAAERAEQLRVRAESYLWRAQAN